MRNILTIAVAMAVGLSALPASPAWAQKSTAVATFAGALPAISTTVATASITKGKSKRFLIAHATVVATDQIANPGNCDIFYFMRANGVVMDNLSSEFTHAEMTCECSSTLCIGCTVSATATLDLDAAEGANPGTFKKQAIDVDLVVDTNDDCVGGAGTATLVVQMVKK